MRLFPLLFLVVLVLWTGCRREDMREMTVKMPGLTEENRAKVVEAIARYDGVRKDSYRWDMKAKTLTLVYDSMRVAQANVRYAIDGAGVSVEFPQKTDDHAGH